MSRPHKRGAVAIILGLRDFIMRCRTFLVVLLLALPLSIPIAAMAGEQAPDQPAESTTEPPARHGPSLTRRIERWLGKFHVLAVHFPIGLITAAAAAESWRMLRRNPGGSAVVRFCVSFGAVGAVGAALLGWVHAPFSGQETSAATILSLHRWIGVAAAAGAVVAAALSELDHVRQRRSALFRAALFGTALFVGAAGHLGGALVYGDDFLHW